jgi:hypothetical protein
VQGKGTAAAPQLRVDGAHLVARCADGGVLRILESDLDGNALDAAAFAGHFGREPIPLNE